MDTKRLVVAVDPVDPRLGINAHGELVMLVHNQMGPLAVSVGVVNDKGWIHFVPIG